MSTSRRCHDGVWSSSLLAVVCTFLLACSATKPSEPNLPLDFPPDFAFGFATVAYQSEGCLALDGGPVASNWCEWDALGKVERGEHNTYGNGFLTGYEADLDRSADLGATSFSYAIDWARLEPRRGEFDQAELQRVVAIVKAIKARGMKPMVVLFHWVQPSWVASVKDQVDLLSQPDRAFVDAFLPLLDEVVPPLAGLVDEWVTLEEPYSIIGGEYLGGLHPPGRLLDQGAGNRALINLMYLNARVYHRVKQLDTQDADGDGEPALVGFENLAFETLPVDATNPEHVKAAARLDYLVNHQFLTGVFKGDIDLDLDGKATTPTTEPAESHDGELERTFDFIGLNYYGRLRADPGELATLPPLRATPHFDVRDYDANLPHSDAWLEISSSGLRTVIEAYSRYGVPLLITENGDPDANDDQRPMYLLQHLYEAGRAVRDGFDVRGYYYWTISDNFEWSEGTQMKEGLFQVDFTAPGFPRTRTRSADLYSQVAHQRRIDQEAWKAWALPQLPVGLPAQ